MLFLISDFRVLSDDFERHVRQLASHGDVFLVHVFDPVEAELPPPGRYRIQLGAQSFTIETADARIRARHREQFERRQQRLRALAAGPGVALIECTTADDPYEILSKRFARV
jgi:hypothetical protein